MRVLLTSLMLFACCSLFAQEKTVTLDSYFNNEHHKDSTGKSVSFHYKWEETDNNGYSIFGNALKARNATLTTLYDAPSAANLQQTGVYIIVDPDNARESPDPHLISSQDISVIRNWVNAGGVLVLFANDSANVELPHFNELAAAFSLHFNNDLISHVKDDAHFEDGAIHPADRHVFRSAKKIFIKDACSISMSHPAYSILKTADGATIIALTEYGHGVVIAVGDPWLYNEYVNGRLPADFDNDKAANDFAKWVLGWMRTR
jgi:hypothetical protein